MSEIKVDKISGKTSANAITVTGENGSTQTSLQQGLAKMWCCWDGDDNPPTINDSKPNSSAESEIILKIS